MRDEIVFYYNPQSRAQIAHWMLGEVEAPYRIVPIDFDRGENRTPQFLAINPMGKLPTIVHDGLVVTEAAAIVAYLADAFPAAGLAPALDDPRRGAYYRWLFFGAGCIEPALLDKMLQRPEPRPRRAVGYGSYEEVLATLKLALTPGPYLLGAHFTAADLYIGAELYWAGLFKAPGIKGEPVFDDYVARLMERPAWKQTIGTTP